MWTSHGFTLKNIIEPAQPLSPDQLITCKEQTTNDIVGQFGHFLLAV